MTLTSPSAEDVVRLVQRLRERHENGDFVNRDGEEASLVIATQRAEIERLRQPVDDEGLEQIITKCLVGWEEDFDAEASVSAAQASNIVTLISPHIYATAAQARREALKEARDAVSKVAAGHLLPVDVWGAIETIIQKDSAK